MSDEEGISFFDTKEYFAESTGNVASVGESGTHMDNAMAENKYYNLEKVCSEHDCRYPYVERRKKLPDPVEKEKGVSLWSMIKDNVGKDLTRVCLPVYFNEPISSLQKCFEDLEYSYLLDRAYQHGRMVREICKIAFHIIEVYSSFQCLDVVSKFTFEFLYFLFGFS